MTDRKDLVRKARQSYDSLKDQGLIEFRCQVLQDWDAFYRELKVNAEQDQLLPILKKTRFQVVVGPSGASTVSHESDAAPPDERVAERIRKSIAGMEQILTGFLHTWSPFAVTSPFPEVESDYQVREVGGKYHLTSHEGAAEVLTSMDHDFAIDELKVTTSDFSGSVRPQFARNNNRFMLVGYEATYQSAAPDAQQLSVKVGYQEVEGLQLPRMVSAIVPFGAGKLPIILNFQNCRVRKR